mmetsp:Transcript_10059/g.22219  ORF Transcript_10059/g.22219 Transcript_10059/m.22219 type:complete len:354 (+) Transcript_10059:260-1321(+)|eukprot:CAMPEP_0206475790 /NCGR_PEP_ID=MMETSP0324_2-20121206/34303_1 /ASSEMBLY_ACC=CAM_ASM_000836 /TAXON_ID=2866 /ORGANISM="Crypthecodinium cohnii, Strain Seligo" /LENGTH=353 /DNA_ID=CAMNT_0053951243 /DNA_START=268 /DNA_END=1329 /DNA_ORIENTATION=-
MPQSCTECFTFSPDVLRLPADDRKKVVDARNKHAKDKFAENELADKAPITFLEEAAVLAAFFVIMGGPLVLMNTGLLCMLFGSWTSVFLWVLAALFLSFHPLPDLSETLCESWFTIALYKYFSYRFIWSDDDNEKVRTAPAWFGASPPHGVLPLANLLCIPAINNFGFREFVGAPASVVFRTPFLRYMTMLGCVDVSGKSMTKAVNAGQCVGLVPDGIAGIFKTKEKDEVVFLKNRKGLAKLALKTGTPLLPAYSLGNTAVFGAWFDPFGIMEALSRKAQTSVFVFWGRFYLPLPRRVNITMVYGKPIIVEKVEDPSTEQIDQLHAEYLQELEALFNRHKASVGWGHKNIRFV